MWKNCLISDLGIIVGGATPSTKDPDNYNGEISWITPRDLSSLVGRYISRGERNISKKGYNSCSTQLVPAGTVLFSSRAPIGYIAIAKNELCTNQGFKSVVPNENTDSMFLYYLLWYNKERIESKGSGTTFKEVSGAVMRNIPVSVPELSKQRAIAATLSCLDDKIELNNKINANLEAQAQAIFKSWFVDFEPFRDDEFVDSGLGPIPKGWRVSSLGEICDSISIRHDFKKDKLIFLNTGDVEDGVFFYHNYSDVQTMPGQAKKSIKKHDILYSEIRPINKHYAYVNFDADDYVVSTKLMVIRAKDVGSRRLYHYLTCEAIIRELQNEAESRSGTFPQIRFENISNLKMVLADPQTENKFCEFLNWVYGIIDSNNEQTAALSTLRNTLLPKLMSGEIEVPIVEAIIQERS
jgi:type I restriction enzyme S subunit